MAWPAVPGAQLERLTFGSLPGFAESDPRPAWQALQGLARHGLVDDTPLRPGLAAPAPLRAAWTAIIAHPTPADAATAREAFAALFEPWRIVPDGGAGFLTGYYEPVLDASPVATADFTAPIRGRPLDLVTFAPGETPPGLAGLQAGRRDADGRLAVYPDRAAIEAGATDAPVLCWLRDPIEAFFVHVQGSARVRMPDGTMRRLTYAGRNGHPYTSIGRLMVTERHVPPADVTPEFLRAWVRANGQAAGDAGAALMARNRSYIFFRFDDTLTPEDGPIGGAGLPLQTLVSLAIDRQIWPYGLPFWIDAALPWESDTETPFRRIVVAADTGSAIVGPSRGDLFMGSGTAAGRRAGLVRHRLGLVVLLPRIR